ncbi:MAG: sensor histidine kinase [Myxococcota bacterium]
MTLADCDLAEVAEQLLAETRATYPGRHVDLAVRGSVRGYFDGDRVAQAMANLIANAITYSAVSEPVTVELEELRSEVAVTVTNRGPAIPPEVLPMLFKPFQRGPSPVSDRDTTRSVGLGLYIVERIVQGHRGRIEVVSQDGLTRFRMLLPRRPSSGRMRALSQSNLPSLG